MKIAVMGYSGSGKSTLSASLGELLGAETLHLDRTYWLPGWTHRTREEQRIIVGDFLDSHGAWVIDGNYFKMHFERRAAEADLIVLLLFPRLVCLRRVWERYHCWKNRSRPDMGVGCREKLDGEFVRWVLWKGRTREIRARYRELQQKYPEKTVVLRSQRELDRFYFHKLREDYGTSIPAERL